MACFTLVFLRDLIIWGIVVAALVAIIQLLIPWLSSITWPMLGQIIRIVLWTIVAIIVVVLVFQLLSCLLSMAGIGTGNFRIPR